ncbi:MAG: cobalt-precorrin-5B (C(1))-methyltransferase CbiD [Bacillota bacterium]
MTTAGYVTQAGKKLRCGVTTGSCAAAAAKAATLMLLCSQSVPSVELTTPKGIALTLDVADAVWDSACASCAVKKDAGDDPDATDGVLVYASVRKTPGGIRIDGGEGVGRVTKPGLDQPVGAAAINSVPRRMIEDEADSVCRRCGYEGGLSVVISIPGGEALAKRTFNPRMGVEGGLSVIGTTGIVEPMSNRALIDTIHLELRQLKARGVRDVLLTPGNYGESFAREALGLSLAEHVSCSNFIGDAIDAALENGFERMLFVGHIGKLVKLGIGMTNTHSGNGDGRVETLLACALEAGADIFLLRAILGSVSTDAALVLLDQAGLLRAAMLALGARIDDCLRRRVPGPVAIGYVCYTNFAGIAGVLAQSGNAEELMQIWRKA